MVTEQSASAADTALLAGLSRALAQSADALQAVLGELGLTPRERARFVIEALQLRQRAQAQTPPASATELELALGVLWVLASERAGERAGCEQANS